MAGGLKRFFFGTGREIPLPSTRKEAFAFYGKERFGRFIALNLILSALAAPSVIWLYASNYRLSSVLSSVAEGDKAAYASAVTSFALVTYSVLAALMLLLFVGAAGVFEVVKKTTFDERCTAGDFFRGIKENALRFLLYGIVFGVSLFFVCFNSYRLSASDAGPLMQGVSAGLGICWMIFLCVFGSYYFTGAVVYRYKLKDLIKNSFILTFTGFFGNLAVVVASCAIPVAAAFVPSPFQMIVLGLFAVLCPGFVVLAVTLRCNHIYDLYINPSLGEEFVGRGLRKEEQEE